MNPKALQALRQTLLLGLIAVITGLLFGILTLLNPGLQASKTWLLLFVIVALTFGSAGFYLRFKRHKIDLTLRKNREHGRSTNLEELIAAGKARDSE